MVPAVFRVHSNDDLSMSFFPSSSANAHIGPRACFSALEDMLLHLLESRRSLEHEAIQQLNLLASLPPPPLMQEPAPEYTALQYQRYMQAYGRPPPPKKGLKALPSEVSCLLWAHDVGHAGTGVCE